MEMRGTAMRKVILSADGKGKIYSVPDEAAENLEKYCEEFRDWIWKNPDGAKLLQKRNGQTVAVYTEADFVDYLNEWIFPHQQSAIVEELDFWFYEIPEKYEEYPRYNF